MKKRFEGWGALMIVMCAVLIYPVSAFAQGGAVTGSLSGLVVDKDGGVIPGATVEIKNNATSEKTILVTNSAGVFKEPALNAGTFTITVTLQGFKTVVVSDVRLLSAQSTALPKITLEVGAFSETIKVNAAAELIHTQETTVSNTITAEQIKNLPVVTRNALSFVTFLPNVSTPGTARSSTIAGLPQSAINISIDGVTTSNLLQSNDGFFSMVTPRLDAVEEVTLSIAGESADSSAQGAVQIKFVTRSGTNNFSGTGYFYGRDPRLNSNYYFNTIAFDNTAGAIRPLPKNDVRVHQYGGSEGGPIIIPSLFDGRGKAFFFHNFEVFHQPNQLNRTRTVMTESMRNGILTYSTVASGVTTVRTIDMFAQMEAYAATFDGSDPALAARIRAANVPDPVITAMLSRIRQSTGTQGVINSNTGTSALSRSTESFIWQPTGLNTQLSPTTKVDINLNTRNRLSGSYWAQRYHSTPDLLNSAEARFPGFVNSGNQNSWRTFGSASLRTTLTQSMVNTVQGGWQTSPNDFFTNIGVGNHFVDQTPAGAPIPISLTMPGGQNPLITAATTRTDSQPRNTPNWNINDDFSWLRGSHSLTFGGSFTQTINTQNSSNAAQAVTLGFDNTNDPALGFFAPANFPGITSTGDATFGTARSMYGILTGRITQLNCTARLNDTGTTYQYCGNLKQRAKISEFGAYAQDSWRVTPSMTLNAGVRWDVLLPFAAITGNYSSATMADLCGVSGLSPIARADGRQCNLFQPSIFNNPTVVPQFTQYNPGTPGFDTKWNLFAPNVGLAWRPNVQNGIGRMILGDPEQALVRGAFSFAFNQPRMDAFTGIYGNNPGGTLAGGATRGTGATNFPLYTGPGGTTGSAPLLLNQPSLLGAAPFNSTLAYPIIAVRGSSVNMFDPNITTPTTKTWSIGLQRAIGRNMAVEVRYTGNRSDNLWTTENWNDFNIFENGFLAEFQAAQSNLQSHIAAGCGTTGNPACSFAYRGPGTTPLPIYMASFLGATGCGDASGRCPNATNPASYTGSLWTNNTFVNNLDPRDPDPSGEASSLWTSTSGGVALRDNLVGAGYPANFFVLNPQAGTLRTTVSSAKSYYHGLTVDVRRRLAQGLQASINYTYARQGGSSLQDLHFDRIIIRDDSGVPHAFKFLYDYQVPVGRGRRFGTNFNRWLDGALGGWEWSGTGRVQWREFEFDGVLHNMTAQDLKNGFKIRKTVDAVTGEIRYFDMDQDIIDNSIKAFNTSATSATGYGSDGPPDPNSRYMAPAAGPGCLYLFRGDCGEQAYFIRGYAFTRFDMSLKKKFTTAGKMQFTLQYDLLNAFDNINFNPNFDPGDDWRVTSAYTDSNGTFDPGGRVGQIVFRINW